MIEITQEQIMQNWNGEIPLVSVCCITYNHEPYIAQALDGFLMQKTSFAFEILVHDDASTDRTADIIREYEKKFPKIIKPIYQKENQYSKGNRAILASFVYPRAKGKYIALCEGDDYWIDENKLQMQVDFLEANPEYGMCYTSFNIYYQNEDKYEYDLFSNKPDRFLKVYNSIEQWVLNKGYIGPMTWVYLSELLDTYDSMNSCDETFVMVAHFMANTKLKQFDNVTSVYRVLEESASHSRNLDKVYARNANLKDIQLKLVHKYNLDSSLIPIIEKKYYEDNFLLFIVLNKQNELKCCKHYMWGRLYSLYLFLSKYELFCSIIKFFYQKELTERFTGRAGESNERHYIENCIHLLKSNFAQLFKSNIKHEGGGIDTV